MIPLIPFCIQILVCVLAVIVLAAVITGIAILCKSRSRGGDFSCFLLLGTKVDGNKPSSMLRDRIQAAAAFLSQNPHTVCIVTGGKGADEHISEAQCMYQELIVLEIDPNRILLEDRSTSTVENIRFSLALLKEKESQPVIGILSSEFHLLRAAMLAKKEGIKPITIPAKTSDPFLFLTYFLREIIMVWYDGLKTLL